MLRTKMINKIKNEEIKAIIQDIYDTIWNDDEAKDVANKVAYWSYKLLEKRGIITENVQQGFVDIMLAAALIHNMYINKEEYCFYDVFKARYNLNGYLIEKGMPEEYRNMLFQLIESQYGETFEVAAQRPTADTPQATMATAKYIVENIDLYVALTYFDDLEVEEEPVEAVMGEALDEAGEVIVGDNEAPEAEYAPNEQPVPEE